MQLALLTTDVLFFVLIMVAVVYAIYAARREHLVAPWRQVGRRPLGMAAAVILCTFVVIAVLDSCHFRARLEQAGHNGEEAFSGEVSSVLDSMLAPLKHNVEKTYSAPFATHAFAKETIETANGGTLRAYPRLT